MNRVITLGEVATWLKALKGRKVEVAGKGAIVDLLDLRDGRVLYAYNDGREHFYNADRTYAIVAQARDQLSLREC